MYDLEEETNDVVYVPFKERLEWKDVIPIKQDDGPSPVCKIAYTAQFEETMDYFRAILHSDERSERALLLTNEVILLNPANYTAWYFRRILLESLKYDLVKELQFISNIGNKNPKNYQIWYHRKAILERLGDFTEELEYTSNQIDQDPKNYHAWAHRQWIVETLQCWDEELQYVDRLLKEDFRNNSAWNQRFFVISRNSTQDITKETRDREMQYTLSFIRRGPNNQSPWAYLKGLFQREPLGKQEELKRLCLEMKEKFISCVHAAALLIDIYLDQFTEESLSKALQICRDLENTIDSIHRKYWAYKRTLIEEKMQSIGS